MARVLIIDPDPDSREILGALLRHAGHEVRDSNEPAAGIGMAIAWRPSAIVTELFVRTDVGWAILDYLGSNPDTAPIPIVVISAYAMPDDEARAVRSGARVFIPKPICAQAVVDTLSRLIDEKRAA